MSGDFFIYFFYNLLCFSVLKYHSSHLNIKFVINLSFHALVHGFHKLLNYVFDVFNIFIVIQSLLKAFVDAHDLRITAEWSVIWVSGWLLFSQLLKDCHYQSQHAIGFCLDDQGLWIDAINAKDFVYFVSEIFQELFQILIVPHVSVFM